MLTILMISFSGCTQKKSNLDTKVKEVEVDTTEVETEEEDSVYIQWEATKLEYPYIDPDPEVEVVCELTEEQMVEKRKNPWKCVTCVETDDPNSKQ